MKTLLNQTVTTIEANNETIKGLRLENNELIKVMIKEVIDGIKEIKQDKLFLDATKKQIIDIIKVRNDIKGNSLLGVVCDYVELSLTIDYNIVTKALFIDLVKAVKQDIISKNKLNKAKTLDSYKELRKEYLTKKEELKNS